MANKILTLSGSPKKDGNTSMLVKWFENGARDKAAEIETKDVAGLKIRSIGCTSCRACQLNDKFECVIDDEVTLVLKKMAEVDVIVMATPLYFFRQAPS